jgi:protein TonB
MGIKGITKLSKLTYQSRQGFWGNGSQLDQTRLNRFIFFSLLLHAAVVISQLMAPANTSSPPTPSPIKVKYVEIQKPDSIDENVTNIDSPKPKKIEKPRKTDFLASTDSRAHSSQKPSIKKEYRRKQTLVPQASGTPEMAQRLQTRAQSKRKTLEKRRPLPLSEKGVVAHETKTQTTPSVSPESLGSRGTLSLLDGFDAKKYAAMDTKTPAEEDTDDNEPISLDTTEAKYVSYFKRIKYQIQRVWAYPPEAAQQGIDGKLRLRFQISRDGNLMGVQLVDSSGFEILDMAAIKAVKEAAPYYPFPITISKSKLSILATFIYSPNYNELKSQ